MTTILIMLALLVGPYAVLTLLDRSGHLHTPSHRHGLIGLALLFMFTASGHFVQTQTMADVLPPSVPWRTAIIYATGVLELAFAVALLVPATARLATVAHRSKLSRPGRPRSRSLRRRRLARGGPAR